MKSYYLVRGEASRVLEVLRICRLASFQQRFEVLDCSASLQRVPAEIPVIRFYEAVEEKKATVTAILRQAVNHHDKVCFEVAVTYVDQIEYFWWMDLGVEDFKTILFDYEEVFE